MCWQQGKANRIKHQCPTSASGLWSQPRCLQEVQTAGTTDRLSTTHLPLDGATNGLSYPQRRPTEPNSTWTFQPTGESPGGVWWIDPGGGSSVPTWYPAFFHSQPGSLQRGKANPLAKSTFSSFCLYGAQADSAWVLPCGQHTPVLATTGLTGEGKLAWRRPVIGNAPRTQTSSP